jgi:hypothetical protein
MENKDSLILRIKRNWLEEIVFGKKRIEYRNNTLFYISRLLNKDVSESVWRKYKTVSFYCPLGATGKILRAEVEYKKTTYNEKNNQYLIHLGKVLKHNLPKPKAKKK